MMDMPAMIPVPLWTDEHGKIRVGNTRILLEIVIRAFRSGESAESIVESYPTLKLGDVYAVIAYYMANSEEVDVYIRQSEEAAERVQQDVEAGYSPETLALRARLRAQNSLKRNVPHRCDFSPTKT